MRCPSPGFVLAWVLVVTFIMAIFVTVYLGPRSDGVARCEAQREEHRDAWESPVCRELALRRTMEKSRVCVVADEWEKKRCGDHGWLEVLNANRLCHNYACRPSYATVFMLLLAAVLTAPLFGAIRLCLQSIDRTNAAYEMPAWDEKVRAARKMPHALVSGVSELRQRESQHREDEFLVQIQ